MGRTLFRRRGIAAALALLAALVVVVVLTLARGSSSPKAAAGSDTSSSDTTVQRRDLVETDTESGTLSYAGSRTVYNRLNGTITWLPRVGQVIRSGQTLFKINGQPVTLMNGTTPAYRELASSDSPGEDVLELNRNLVALGFNPDGIVVDDSWQAATTAGVEAFQASLRESQTGRLALGQVVFLPGAQQVSAVQGTLGASAGDRSPSNGPEFVGLDKTVAPKHNKPRSKNRLGRLKQLVAQLKAEIAHMRADNNKPSASPSSSPSSNNSNNSNNSNSSNRNNNGGGGAGAPILQTSSTRLTVTVDLDASKQSEAKVGEAVTVEMPAGDTINGRITAVSRVAQSSNNGNGDSGNDGSSGSTIPVTIALLGRQSDIGLDKASVSVNFSQAKANHVLSVPVTALLATGGGRYSVQEAAPPHKLIAVTTGLFAAGYVEISGAGIHPGLKVTDSQG
jgi:peptidoglycan hydrolase-like protein with peptidoglycan-binding domain